MTTEGYLITAAIFLILFGIVAFCLLVGSIIDEERRRETQGPLEYQPARAAARALRTPVVLPPGHPSRGVVSAEDFAASVCPDEVDDERGAA